MRSEMKEKGQVKFWVLEFPLNENKVLEDRLLDQKKINFSFDKIHGLLTLV